MAKLASEQQAEQYKAVTQGVLQNYSATYDRGKIITQAAMELQGRYASIPDIKGEANIVHEDGQLYPHHNLYFIISESWDTRALQAVLLSGIARLFVAAYSTKMRGGYLRFQAQYLRRIRLPKWEDVPVNLKRTLVAAAKAKDLEACNEAAFALYGLTPSERAALGGTASNGA